MIKSTISILIILLFLCLSTSLCLAQPVVSSSELLSNAKVYDGKEIFYKGEVIGDVMIRGASAWVNLNDGSNAIGIWMSADDSKIIEYSGSYKSKGDILEVTGIFNRACSAHGGDLDIHAQTVRRINAGRDIKERLNTDKVVLTLILLGVVIFLWILSLLKKN